MSEKTIIDWRKEALAAGVEGVSKLNKEQCKEAIAGKKRASAETTIKITPEPAPKDEEPAAPVEPAPKDEEPVVAAVTAAPAETIDAKETRLLRELDAIESRKKEIGKELQGVIREREATTKEFSYIDQLKMSRAQDKKAKADKTQELAEKLKSLM